MPNISSATTIQSVQLTEQSTAAAQPSTGYFRIYASSGSILRGVDDSGNDYPFATGSIGPDISTQTFLVVSTSSDIPNSRKVIGTSNRISITDAGALGNFQFTTPQDLHTGASVQFNDASLTTATITTRASVGTSSLDSSASLHVVGQYYSRMYDDGTFSASTCSVDWSSGNEHKAVLTTASTISFANAVTGGRYVLLLQQDSTGSRTMTWPAAVLWPNGGTAPTLSTTGSKTDLFTFFFDGTSYYGNYSLTH